MNISLDTPSETIAKLFHLLGQPARLQILLAVGDEATCVCHLEACLGFRQAYISQQLMALRDAGLVVSRREGKHIYYGLSDPGLIDLIRQAGWMAGISPQLITTGTPFSPVLGCTCPRCLEANTTNPESRPAAPLPTSTEES